MTMTEEIKVRVVRTDVTDQEVLKDQELQIPRGTTIASLFKKGIPTIENVEDFNIYLNGIFISDSTDPHDLRDGDVIYLREKTAGTPTYAEYHYEVEGTKLHTCNEEGLKKKALAVEQFARMNGFKRYLFIEVNVRENVAYIHYGKETRDIFPILHCPFCGEELIKVKEEV